MAPRGRPFAFGMACLVLGWVSAGYLEWSRASVLTAVLVLFVLLFVVAALADRVGR